MYRLSDRPKNANFPMIERVGDIAQDESGWFFRWDGTGWDCVSEADPMVQPVGNVRILVRDGKVVPGGDALATRVAMVLYRRGAK